MSYISNGCNDCSPVDFGNNNLYNTGGMNFLDKGSNDIGIFDNGAKNQQTFPDQQQMIYQPNFQQQQQPQQPQQPQQHQQPQQQMQRQQQVVIPQQLPGVPRQQPSQMRQVEQMANVPVTTSTMPTKSSGGLQDIIGNYLVDNAFTLTIAFLVASAWHTTIKYYIDQAIKFNTGTPTYYVVYAVIATLVAIFLSSLKH